MAKRRRVKPQTAGIYPATKRPPGSRGSRRTTTPPRPISRGWLALGVVAVAIVLVGGGFVAFFAPGTGATPSPPASPVAGLQPPAATPLANPPAAPAGDGTTATIHTEQGDIVIELYNESAPVASENFVNLAEAGFYDGVGFHRIIPGFMIQGGDPEGTGSGGPGYTIADEPVVGSFTRGTVAMARTPAPHSEGSQFFILVGDAPWLDGGGYTIFGNVVSGMDVADQIVSGDTTGPQNDLAVNPVKMTGVTIQGPGE